MRKLCKINSLQIVVCALVLCAPAALHAQSSEASKEASESAIGLEEGLIWGLVATEALLYGFDAFDAWVIGPPLIGPTFDVDRPDVDYLLSEELTPTIGSTYMDESVPTSWLIYGAVGTLAGLNGLEAAMGNKDWRVYHDLSLGLAASVFTTVTVTELLKRSVGRLRPDFRDRFIARGCQGELGVHPEDLPCDEVPASLKQISEKEYDYGRRSFPSGHASTSFALGTFAAHYFWNLGQTFYTQDNTLGSVLSWGAGLAALGVAGGVAGTRLRDHRHHLTDVLAGSFLGASIATVFYTMILNKPKGAPSNLNVGINMVAHESPLLSMRMQW
jgi:membrane-associated phospholipid phosphatase